MINLLPPQLKEEIAYSRRNTVLRRYIILSLIVVVLLAGMLVAAGYYLNQQIAAAQQQINQKQQKVASYHQLEQQARTLTARLHAIHAIQGSQTKFSVLLADLAQVMPQGTAIDSITLTGNSSQPVQISVEAVNYQTALGFRDSLTQSKLISAADINSIAPSSSGSGSTYTVSVTLAFNPGALK